MDISNGSGVRVSIFVQGCTFNCKNCFNPETHDFNGGKEFTDEVLEHILDLCDNENVEGLSILGGEPMHPKNIEAVTKLAKKFKERFVNFFMTSGRNVQLLWQIHPSSFPHPHARFRHGHNASHVPPEQSAPPYAARFWPR